MPFPEAAAPVPPEASGAELAELRVERRRPNRIDYTNPQLIALLRRPTATQADAPADPLPLEDDGDALRPMRGIALAMLLSAVIWAAIVAAMWSWL